MADRAYWENLIKGELIQRCEEGCDVTAIEQRFNEADKDNVTALEAIFAELEALPIGESFPYVEPSTLEEVGREINLTRERVRQIQVEGLRRLREILIKQGLNMENLFAVTED